MLGEAYRWIDSEEGSFLRLRYGCVAGVKLRDGKVVVWINVTGKEVTGTAGSIAQGKRYVERWIAARGKRPRREPFVPSPAVLRKWQGVRELEALFIKPIR
jgi:hypothetical protein